jgi:hypothetical protein
MFVSTRVRMIRVGWDKVAPVNGGPAQTKTLGESTVFLFGKRVSDQRPTGVTVCLSHPTTQKIIPG